MKNSSLIILCLFMIGFIWFIITMKPKSDIVPFQQARVTQPIRFQKNINSTTDVPKTTPTRQFIYTDFETDLMRQGFIDIEKLDKDFKVELGYRTKNNFTGHKLYTNLNHAFVHPKMADKLLKAKELLQAENINYTFLIFDALRPNSVQYKMWDAVKDTPKQRYVAHPKQGSIHNYGLSVDITIFDLSKGKEISMGTPIDFLGREAEYRYNRILEQEGKITEQERLNREFLRKVMVTAGFKPINSEWWHFNTFSTITTRKNYKMIY